MVSLSCLHVAYIVPSELPLHIPVGPYEFKCLSLVPSGVFTIVSYKTCFITLDLSLKTAFTLLLLVEVAYIQLVAPGIVNIQLKKKIGMVGKDEYEAGSPGT